MAINGPFRFSIISPSSPLFKREMDLPSLKIRKKETFLLVNGSENNHFKRRGFFVHSIYHLPMDLEEDIPENHLVRVVNTAVNRLDDAIFDTAYPGGGRDSYHPNTELGESTPAWGPKQLQ